MDEDARKALLAAAAQIAPGVPGGLYEDLAEAEFVSSARPVPRAGFLRIYETRLARWQAERIPNCDGLPEFVRAVREGGSEQVTVGWFGTSRNTWLILLGSDSASIDAAVRINEPPRTPPSPDIIATGEW